MRPPTSDERWRDIRAAVPRHVPSTSARIEIERALAAFAFGKKVFESKIKAERAEVKEIIERARQFKIVLHRRRRREIPWPETDPEQPLRDLQAVISIERRYQDRLDILRRRNPARAVLLLRLLDIWVDHFGGKLTTTNPTRRGRAPSGPLVQFVLAATRGVVRPPISPHTIHAHDVRAEIDSSRLQGLAADGVL